MSEYIDVYIDTTTKVSEDATKFDYELFECFMSGGPLVAHSKYMELKAENAKLREQLAKARDPQRIGGTADPESFVYAIEQLREFRWQHATNDEDAIPYINNVAAAHERENAKLRGLVEDMHAALQAFCDAQDVHGDNCPLWVERTDDCELRGIERRMRELGVEVNDG